MEENLDALIEVIIEDMKEERLYKEKLYKEKEEIMGKLTEIIGNEIGIVSTIGDGIITIKGLKEIVFGEMIEIIIPGGENIMGIILNIEKKKSKCNNIYKWYRCITMIYSNEKSSIDECTNRKRIIRKNSRSNRKTDRWIRRNKEYKKKEK